ncbi:hypothetical protein [Microscilla marina]|uniref:Uncharacterized protein n=1 Tax=Microscilla marina ATCC 23134 TaxID=313606 RepID=A1ZYQ0_MICM2|nr:hypothetical protein [Microscilla marina]EAY24474.1 hypothetical protein M23134_06461 [Microscilla marina ATCC 23134]
MNNKDQMNAQAALYTLLTVRSEELCKERLLAERALEQAKDSRSLVEVVFYEKELEIIDRLDGELSLLMEQTEQLAEANREAG